MEKIFRPVSLFACTLLLALSCTSKGEKTISEYLLKQNGQEVKLYDFKEERKITVADSLQIIEAVAESNRKLEIDSVQALLDKYKAELSDGASQILSTPTLRDAYASVIVRGESTLDSLKKAPLEFTNIYEGQPLKKVLSVIYSAKVDQKDAPVTYFELTEKLDSCKQILYSLDYEEYLK